MGKSKCTNGKERIKDGEIIICLALNFYISYMLGSMYYFTCMVHIILF